MLYIQETKFNDSTIKNVIEKYTDVVKSDYYSEDRVLGNPLPLSVLNLASGESTAIKNGFTISDEMVAYSSCRGNIVGLFLGHDEKWYFFLSGRRHGVAVAAMNYFLPELIPELGEPVVYISQNTTVGPLETDVKPTVSSAGTIYTEEVEVDECNALELYKPTYLNGEFIKKLKAQAALWGEGLPVDLVDFDLSSIVVKVGAPEEWAPTVTVDGLRFKGESITSDCNGISVTGGIWALTIKPQSAGNRHTEMTLSQIPKR